MTVIAMSNTTFEVQNFEGVSRIDFSMVAGVPVYTIYQTEKSTMVNGNDFRVAIM